MSTVIFAVAPIFALIFVGFGLRRINFPGDNFWPVSERLTYFVLLPALLVQGLSGKELHPDLLPLSGSVLSAILTVALLTRLIWPMLKIDGPAYTSLFQGAFRPNTYIGMSIAAVLLGPDWLTLSAMALLAMIPVINVICVLTLSRYASSESNGLGHVLLELMKNPLIIACVIGLVLNLGHITLPRILNDLLDILGRAALPMGLLAAGAGLRLERIDGGKRSLIVSSTFHLVVLPVVAVGYAWLYGADETARLAAVIYTAIPVSVSSFILSRQMGGDHRLMAQIITFQTLIAMATLPVALVVLG
ncbi:AEC family transporter [Pseudodesulfovibrio sp. zrk46]|uniref:AEC family transporter n=1 Tax=Pseudodesulfovibrio sp. zrk46 TaxID=2725288 RepID=UPI001449A9A9|nr:AEC family transporter [Pseudodesulfovibrio sp. zrk46]QJB56510.1 AEC family transporter [Pseudodesulfovibrio sp. zrk46]